MPRKPDSTGRPAEETDAFLKMLEDYRWEISAKERRAITKTELAEKLGVKKQTFFGWYGEHARPKPSLIWQIADITGMDADALFAGAGYPKTPYRPKSVWDTLMESARAETDPAERARLLQFVNESRAAYEQSQGRARVEDVEDSQFRKSAG